MKKYKKLLFTVLASAAVFFNACSMMDDASVSDSDAELRAEVKMTTLTGQIPNLKDYDSSEDVRTILPAADAKEYDYYIMGKTITGVDYIDPDDTSHKYKQLKKGESSGNDIEDNAEGVPEFTLPIASAAWELTLCAVPKGATGIDETNMVSQAALVAYAFADLTKNTDPVLFTLSPDGLNGVGDVALTLWLCNKSDKGTKASHPNLWELPAGYTVDVQIQNLITGEVIKYADAGTPPASVTNVSFVDPDSTDNWGIESKSSAAIGSGHKLNPGTYNFVVMFKNPNLPTSVWSDVLVVLPTKSTTQDVYIPNVLGALPAKVTTFNGWSVDGSIDNPERLGYYLAHFEWDAPDTLTERFFEIQLGELDPKNNTLDAPVTTDTLWNDNATLYRDYAAEAGTGNRVELRKQEEYYDGSLLANNTRCTIYIPLGKALTARIRSVNNVGESDWTYITLPKDPYAAATMLPAAANAGKGGQASSTSSYSTDINSLLLGKGPLPFDSAAPAKIMNKFRITYDLNGGVTKTDSSTNKVVYGSQSNLKTRNTVKFWAANGADIELKKSPSSFNCWSTKAVPDDDSRIYKAVTAATPASPSLGDYGSRKDTTGTGGDITFKQTTVAKVGEMKGVVTGAGDKNASDIEAKDDGGYIGVENLYLYADYSTDFDADVTKEDATADFFLATDWIKLASEGTGAPDYNPAIVVGTGKSTTSAADAKVETTAVKVISKKKEAKSNNTNLIFSVVLPCADASSPMEYYVGTKKYTLNELCKTAKVSLKVQDAQKVVYVAESKTLSGGQATFAKFDITTWENGRYTAYIDMTVIKSARPITRSVRITLDIVD